MKLETKLCVDPSGPCAVCGQKFARKAGLLEIYLADSENFCCYDCSAKTDQQLSNWVYRPLQYVGPGEEARCPVCGCVDDEVYLVGTGVPEDDARGPWSLWWHTCRKHGYRFRSASFLAAPTTPVEEQKADRDYLARLIEVPPLIVPRPPDPEPREPEFQSVLHQLEAMRKFAATEDEPLAGMIEHLKAEVTAIVRLFADKFGVPELKILGVSVGADLL